jgi:hypothetical protein
MAKHNTSPAVILAKCVKMPLDEDGESRVLIEGRPALIDSVALVPKNPGAYGPKTGRPVPALR